MLNASYLNPDVEDTSVMEMFMLHLRSKMFASIPTTDAECYFNWLFGRCYPLCKCRFSPKFGDYSPSRACRLIPVEEIDEKCEPTQRQTPWFLRLAGALVKTAQAVHRTALVVGKAIADNAPPTDDKCKWSWRLDGMGCRPKKECALIFEMGDYSLDRMCRLRVEVEDENDGEGEMEEDAGEDEGEDQERGKRRGPVNKSTEPTLNQEDLKKGEQQENDQQPQQEQQQEQEQEQQQQPEKRRRRRDRAPINLKL
jgi:hypothetical protein